MNKIDFLKYSTFPLDSDSLDFIQEMVATVAKMSAICGEKVIVAGCGVRGNYVDDGLVIIKGELLEFKGDTQVSTVYIEETKDTVICLEEAFEDLYITRCVKFGLGDGTNNFNWSEFKRLDSIPVLMDKIKNLQTIKSDIGHQHVISDITNLPNLVVPKGLIAMWSGVPKAVPVGWTLCDKGYDYQGIYVPNLKGRFIVGYDPNDSDYNEIKKEGGEKTVTLKLEQMPSHNHTGGWGTVSKGNLGLIRRSVDGDRNTPKGGDDGQAGNEPDVLSTPQHIPFQGNNKAHENRPPYYVLAYIIKI